MNNMVEKAAKTSKTEKQKTKLTIRINHSPKKFLEIEETIPKNPVDERPT